MDRIKFMNIEIDNVTMKEALHEINRLVKKRGKAYSVTPNVDHIMKLQTDKEFVEIYGWNRLKQKTKYKGENIGTWVARQKRAKKDTCGRLKITEERIKLLENIGIIW